MIVSMLVMLSYLQDFRNYVREVFGRRQYVAVMWRFSRYDMNAEAFEKEKRVEHKRGRSSRVSSLRTKQTKEKRVA